MNRALWDQYRASAGATRKRLLTQLITAEEPLAQSLVAKFVAGTRLCTDSMRDDLIQAARVGILTAIDKWDPAKGAFSTIAGYECRKEMQEVRRHAKPISDPKGPGGRAWLPPKKQHAADVFYAIYGCAPDPEEIGVTEAEAALAIKASAEFVPADDDLASEDAVSPEEYIDEKRRAERFQAFLGTLTPQETADFWAGRRQDLVEQAKAAVSGEPDEYKEAA